MENSKDISLYIWDVENINIWSLQTKEKYKTFKTCKQLQLRNIDSLEYPKQWITVFQINSHIICVLCLGQQFWDCYKPFHVF